MGYRESAQTEHKVYITAKMAIRDLYQEFHELWDVESETLFKYLAQISDKDGGSSSSPHHVVHILRMLNRNGHSIEVLGQAIMDLEEEGAFEMKQTTEVSPVVEVHSHVNPYEKEVVKSEWEYPKRYTPLRLEEQIEVFSRYYPRLKMPRRPIEEEYRSDGFTHMAIPKLSAVAHGWNIKDPFGTGYEAVIKRLSHVVQTVYRRFRFGFAKSALDLNEFSRFAPREDVRRALKKLESQQPTCDMMMFHCQMGLRFRGSSMRRIAWLSEERAKVTYASEHEFLLPAYVILSQLLIQPERLMNPSALGMYCAGDQVTRKGFLSRDGIGFAFGEDVLQLLDYSTSKADNMFGVPTGLVSR